MKNILTFILILMIGNFSLNGQSRIEGSISDENGKVMAAVAITIKNSTNPALTKQFTSDQNGYFIAEGIIDGNYLIEITSENYKTITLRNFNFPRDTDQVMGVTLHEKKKVETVPTAIGDRLEEDRLSIGTPQATN
jgi:hypothetical protein